MLGTYLKNTGVKKKDWMKDVDEMWKPCSESWGCLENLGKSKRNLKTN